MLLFIINMVTRIRRQNPYAYAMQNNRAKSFVAIMVVIAAASFVLRFSAEQIIRASVAQNESNATATLKLITVALENYAKANNGKFPSEFSILTESAPAYLDKDYTALSSFRGYTYRCPQLESGVYRCIATPAICRVTGKTIYTISTGGVFVSEDCVKKE